MNITRRFLLWGAAAVAAATSLKPVAAALPPAPPTVPAWVPEGWLPCWGQSVSRKEYPRLFALIGDTYGETDGETFVLPDLRGRYFMLPDGSTGVTNDPGHTHSITTHKTPSHSHSFPNRHTHIAPTVTIESIISTGDTWHTGFVSHFARPLA